MSLNDITNDSIIQCKHKHAIGDLKLVADNVANTHTHYLVSHDCDVCSTLTIQGFTHQLFVRWRL